MRAFVCLVLVLSFSARSQATTTPPLVTAEYQIRAGSWEEHVAQANDFAEALKSAMKNARPYKKKPSAGKAYLDAARVISDAIGHHDLAFLFVRRARSLLESERGGDVERLLQQCNDLEDRLAKEKLAALRQLGDPELPMPGDLRFTAAENTLRLRRVPNQPDGTGDYTLASHFTDLRGGKLLATYREVNGIDQVRYSENLFEPGGTPQTGEVADLFASGTGGYFLDPSRSHLCHLNTRPMAKSCLWGEMHLLRLLYIQPPESTFSCTYGLKGTLGAVGVETEDTRRGVMVTSLRDPWRVEFGGSQPPYPLQDQMSEVIRFGLDYPQFREDLRTPMGEITFAEAKATDQAALYRTYLESFPNGPHVSEARRLLAEKEFEHVRARNTTEAYRQFIDEFPDHDLVEVAKDSIEVLAIERIAGEATGDELEQALVRLTREVSVARGQELLAEIRFTEASHENTISAYQDFQRRFPDSKWSQIAQRSIEEIKDGARFSAVRKTNSQAGYRTFLDAYPNSRFTYEARAMLDYFQFQEDSSIEAARSFFSNYRKSTVKAVAQVEYGRVRARLEELKSVRDTDAPALILLFDETGDRRMLGQALDLADNEREEHEALKRLTPKERGDFVFPITLIGIELDPTWDVSWFRARQESGQRLELDGNVTSRARFGRYRIEVEYSLTVDYEKYYSGVKWFNSDYNKERKTWSKTFRSSKTIELRPAGSERQYVQFKLPKIITSETPGIEFIVGWTTVGQPRLPGDYRVTTVELLN